MIDVLKPMHMGQALGIKGKNLTLGLYMAYFASYSHAKKVIRKTKDAAAAYEDSKRQLSEKHNIEKGEIDQQELDKDAKEVVHSQMVVFTNACLMTKNEYGILRDIGFLIDKTKELIPKGDRELKILNQLQRDLEADINLGEEELRIELKKLFDLEKETRGGGAGVQFMLKVPTLAIIQRLKMKWELKHMRKDEKRIESIGSDVEKIYKMLKKGSEHVKKNFDQMNSDLKRLIKLVRNEMKESYELLVGTWINLQVVLGILNEDIKLTEHLAARYEIPKQMAYVSQVNKKRLIEYAHQSLHHQQIEINQLIAVERAARKAA